MSLAFDANSGKVIRVGHNGFGLTREDVFDPSGSERQRVRGVDPFSAGGLAAQPVPEPSIGIGLVAGVVALLGLRRRRFA